VRDIQYAGAIGFRPLYPLASTKANIFSISLLHHLYHYYRVSYQHYLVWLSLLNHQPQIIATMAARTHAQDIFDKPEEMPTFSNVHTYDATLPPSLATGTTGSQQMPTPDDFTHLAQQPHSGKHICRTFTMWFRSNTISLRDACACNTPSNTRNMVQSPASRLETSLDSFEKTSMSMHPKTANPHFISLPTGVKPHVIIGEVIDTAARSLPAQTPGCETAAETRSKPVTTIAVWSTGQTTTHGNESADTPSGGFGSANAPTTAGPSPDDATNDPGENQDGPRASSQPGVVHMTAITCK
jgi:hypothetical protein